MKGILVAIAAVVGLVSGEAPYPPSGWKPTGARLVLPSARQYQQYAAPPKPLKLEYGPPAPRAKSPEELNELARLKATAGSKSGVYHVLLPDGRLQKVEYAAAPLKQREGAKPQKQQSQAGSPHKEPNNVVAQFSSLRDQILMIPAPASYLAALQYSDVPPVPPPVFAYNDQPSLVRIIRK